MALINGDNFCDSECMELFRRERLGSLAVSVRGLPMIVPAPYVVDDAGFVIGVYADEVSDSMYKNVIALQAQGWCDDTARHWTTVAVGIPAPMIVQDEYPILTEAGVTTPWCERHVFRLPPQLLSGRWLNY